jgi:hypothetical protein
MLEKHLKEVVQDALSIYKRLRESGDIEDFKTITEFDDAILSFIKAPKSKHVVMARFMMTLAELAGMTEVLGEEFMLEFLDGYVEIVKTVKKPKSERTPNVHGTTANADA